MMKRAVLWLLVAAVCAVAVYAIASLLVPLLLVPPPPYADIPRITYSGEWPTEPLPGMLSDARLHEIAIGLADKNMDRISAECPYFAPLGYHPELTNRYIYDGVPALRLVLASCYPPNAEPPHWILYAHIDRQTGTEVHFETTGLEYPTEHILFSIRP